MHGEMETIQNSENMRQLLNGAPRGQRVIFTRVRRTFYKQLCRAHGAFLRVSCFKYIQNMNLLDYLRSALPAAA